jgi:hypothetical protein
MTVIHGIDFEASKNDLGRKRRDDIFRTDLSDTMHLESMKSGGLIVSVFFDMNGQSQPTREEKVRYAVLLNAIRVAFDVLYSEQLAQLSKIKSMEEEAVFVQEFANFNVTTDQLSVNIMSAPSFNHEDWSSKKEYDSSALVERSVKFHLQQIGVNMESIALADRGFVRVESMSDS